MAPMVELVNRVSGGIGRAIDWIHMPVPIERDDEPYFEAIEGAPAWERDQSLSWVGP